MTDTARPDGRLATDVESRRTPLRAVLAFTAVNAVCSGLVTSGLFFATTGSYGFDRSDNYLLGATVGAAYTGGALLASRVLARARGQARALAAWIQLLLGCACTLPLALRTTAAICLTATIYCTASAVMWPIIQSYVTSGRSGAGLRRAVGWFNWTWSSGVVLAFAVLGPSLEHAPETTLAALGGLHVAGALCLAWFARAPCAAGGGAVEVPDARDVELRRVFQRMLPVTNLLAFALAPFLPGCFAALGLPVAARASFAIGWLLPRAVAFFVLGRWHGWHHRRGAALAGALCLILGFAAALLAPWLDTGALGLVLEFAGLASFGVGMATVYTAAFYYAQVTGRAAVGAGGRHEALLGLGATAGPLLGLAVALLADSGVVAAAAFEPVLALCCVGAAVAVVWHAWRAARVCA